MIRKKIALKTYVLTGDGQRSM